MRGDLFLDETPLFVDSRKRPPPVSDLLHLRILGGRLLELVRLY